MRYCLGGFFAFVALALAACGGGGGSSPLVPGPAGLPTSHQLTPATLVLKIPAKTQGGSARRPAYISPSTQSVSVSVQPVGAGSPTPVPAQYFAVATPSPCAAAEGGGLNCTFHVQAVVGQDTFTVSTFAVASPGPNATPLSTFTSGVVSVTAGGTPPPLAFTLSGVIDSVKVAVPSPDPSNSPNTQVIAVGTALPQQVLSVTPYDAGGNPIMSDTFDKPLTVSVSPANAGLSLHIVNPQCSPAPSSTSGASVQITCAKDLANVRFSYDGTIAYASGNVVDNVTISAQPQSSAPPAHVALAGTTFAFPLATAPAGPPFDTVMLAPRADGTFNYTMGGFSQSAIGRFDPKAPANSVAYALGYQVFAMTTDSFGDIWLADFSGDALHCYKVPSAASDADIPLMASGPPSPTPVQPIGLTTDRNGNVWFYGHDQNGTGWAGHFSMTGACTPSAVTENQQVGTGDTPIAAAPGAGGTSTMLALSQFNLYAVSAGGGNVSSGISGALYGYGQAVTSDAAGNAFAAFAPEAGNPQIAEAANGASAFTAMTLPAGLPVAIASFPDARATRLAYADRNNAALGLAQPNSTVAPTIIPIDATSACTGVAYDAHGDPWVACTSFNGMPIVEHVVTTSTWSVANSNIAIPPNGAIMTIGINERGDSGPFTVTHVSDPTAVATAAPWPGFDHDIPLAFTGAGSATPSVTFTDAHGRSQTVTF
ncbi:MAG TPA: hypothetical protein VGN11_04185, partial [Candidatus Baltobacteraceae bacterium]|nr:hypothetical protein [Candidatus Baltobacteraceae bacterium]